MLKKECTSKSYEIEIDDLMEVLNTDDEWMEDEGGLTLCEKLEMADGVTDVDYNGHFGHYIYMTIDQAFDTKDNWKKIENIITGHIKDS